MKYPILVALTLQLFSFAQSSNLTSPSSCSSALGCPVEVVRLNLNHKNCRDNMATTLTYGDTTYNAHNKFWEVRVRNNTDKTIRAIKFVTAYYDATEDLTTIPRSWGLHDETDGTKWQPMSGNDSGYEWWRNRKHPRVNKAPNLDGVKQQDEESAARERAQSSYKANGPALPGNADPPGPATAIVDVSSTPPNADIEVDGSFVGNTPSSLGLTAGEHTLKITKIGYKPWEIKVITYTGAMRLVAELESVPSSSVPRPNSSLPVESDRTLRVAIYATEPLTPFPAKTAEYAKTESASLVGESDKKVVENRKPRRQFATNGLSGEPSICGILGIRTETTDIAGAKISAVASASAADHAGLHVGDIVTSVDGTPVGGPAELEAELRNRAPGTNVRVAYMFRSSVLGYFAKEVIFVLPQK
jgi:hypothetical protein